MFHFLKTLILGDQHNPPSPKTAPLLFRHSRPRNLSSRILVYDVEGALMRSSSTFPYFMLVAFEGGGLLRSFLLLLLYPLLCFVNPELGLRIMVMVSFCGLRKESFRAGRAVLPKFFLEDVGLEAFEILREGGSRVCVTSLPRVMVEGFLKEYLEVEMIVGSELKVSHGYYTGLMVKMCNVNEVLAFLSGGEQLKSSDLVGFSSSSNPLQHPLFSLCKEVFLVSEVDKRNWHSLPRGKCPKPLIFHDGRLAFRPTPVATLSMFAWLPLGFPLAILRLMIVLLLPYKASTPILAITGVKWRLKGLNPSTLRSSTEVPAAKMGHLYVCNHRTLIDPVYVSIALNKRVWAVTYSASRFSEIISPIKTARLMRNREEDRKMMAELLRQGDVVVCPEGTTCREPFLLRFSPLFAELSDEIIPVVLNVHVSMFYATTAGGLKWLDPFFYLLNPSTTYVVEFLEKMDTNDVKVGKCSSIDMANHIQTLIGRRLGFECTMFTRKDKYRMLAGNDGAIRSAEG